jgi:sporulation protein YlmC with PRC-barrel domain
MVKDVYLDASLESITSLYLGQESFLSRKALLIVRADVKVFGHDVILVKSSYVVGDSSKVAEAGEWLRRDRLQGRPINTSDGVKVGTVGDVIVDDEAQIIGFSLSRIFVEGAVAQDRAVHRKAITGVGNDDEPMIIDLTKAEQRRLVVS